jgi:hypothetical protein
MPSYADSLFPEEIWWLVTYLESLPAKREAENLRRAVGEEPVGIMVERMHGTLRHARPFDPVACGSETLTRRGAFAILRASMTLRYLVTVAVLVGWVVLGPLAMAFGGCAGMGTMCEGPCGTTSCVILASTDMPAAPPVAEPVQFSDRLEAITPKVLEPPPKSAPLAA